MKNKGFTLFELLITISIIGILTAIATISFSSAQKKGRDARRIQDMKNIQTAAEQYYSQSTTSSYPSLTSFNNFVNTLVGSSLMQTAMTDPKNTDVYVYNYSNVGYVYQFNTSDYCICARLENNIGNASYSSGNCNFTAAVKNYYCVKNQQ